jgi:hypothetical protein
MGLVRDKVLAEGKEYTLVAGKFNSTPAVVSGQGYTVTTPGTGRYLITFENAYTSEVSFVATVQATTPGDVAGHTLVYGAVSANAVEVVLYNASFAAHNLAANEWINFVAVRKRTSA